MPICLYCNEEKDSSQFSQEHIIPRAIGGNLIPNNPFATNDVCRRCNSVCGAYIDGPFIKSWFNHNYRSDNILKYSDISKNPIVPLTYMGILNNLEYEGKICDLWMGPTGDIIYHFHERYPDIEDISPMVGIPSYAKKKDIDHGFVFLFVRSNNPVWHPTIIYSFIEQFKYSSLYLGNGPTPKGGRFSEIPPNFKNLHKDLTSMTSEEHHAQVSIGLECGDRFIFKVALGLGCVVLDKSFRTSKSADLLRKAMWSKTSDERLQLPIYGTGFGRGEVDTLEKILNWPDGHLIYFFIVNDTLNLYVSFYEKQVATIRISEDPKHWDGIIKRDGLIYVISPGLQNYVGPKTLSTFIAHKTSSGFIDNDLANLEFEMKKIKELPPYVI